METKMNWKVMFFGLVILSVAWGISPSLAGADQRPDQVLIDAKIVETSASGDRMGAGDQNAPGSTGTSSGMPSHVTLDADGNYVLGSGEKLTAEQFIERYPIWSGVILGAPPAASQSVSDFYY